MIWVDKISQDRRRVLNKIGGSLGLPSLSEYESEDAFLHEIYVHIVEAKSLIRQAAKNLNCEM